MVIHRSTDWAGRQRLAAKFQNAGISRESGLRRVEMHVLRPQWPIELAQMDDAVLR